ncbi:hypothetical protein [Fuchsiella alkaliacetigena]|uniref:hypothetical protein n=1 Tax=Fuchsiella alkaliacetigena TaxID=957042 RepID=UPI00200A3BF6|nr:hypothetical protein [Fuchsiella alkaliacetigena]MCK8823807.1 hypothetical protein [Fuchsiella alkaliacetigena]
MEAVKDEFTPYLGKALHRQGAYQKIQNLVDLLSQTEVEVDLIDNTSRSKRYGRRRKIKETENIEQIDYSGYRLELDLADKNKKLNFRTASLFVQELEEEIKLIFPNEEQVGQRLIVKIT